MGLNFWNTLMRVYKANDFSVVFTDKDWDASWSAALSAQITAASYSATDRQVTIKVRQTRNGMVQNLLMQLSKPETAEVDSVELKPLNGDAYVFRFLKGKMIKHDCAFDYHDTDPAYHTITFQFESMEYETVETRRVKLTVA